MQDNYSNRHNHSKSWQLVALWNTTIHIVWSGHSILLFTIKALFYNITCNQYLVLRFCHHYKNTHRCHDFDDCFSSCTKEVTGLSGCDVKEDFRFNSSTTETFNPLRFAKLIMWTVPRLLPSQNAIRASDALAISALRIMPAALPKALHLAGWSSMVSPCS